MDLIFRSALHQGQSDFLKRRGPLKLLFLYQEIGFVNSTMGLIRAAAAKAREPASLFCAVWHFGIIAKPLLKKMAALEASAADMIIVGLRGGDPSPPALNDWLKLWFWTHLPLFVATEAFSSGFNSSPTQGSQLERIGELGKVKLVTIGGSGELALVRLKNDLAQRLASPTKDPMETPVRIDASLHQRIPAPLVGSS